MVAFPPATLALLTSRLHPVGSKKWLFHRTALILFARAFSGKSLSLKWFSNNDISAESNPEQ